MAAGEAVPSVIYAPAYRKYSFGDEHPFSPVRTDMMLDLLGALGHRVETVEPEPATREDLLARAGDVLGWVADGSLKIRVGREIPLERAAEAHRLLEGRQTTGKVLLIP